MGVGGLGGVQKVEKEEKVIWEEGKRKSYN
jgi:hypothetical protein